MNVANCLTLARIIAIIPIVVLILVGEDWAHWVAAALFLIAAITDYFDGVVARRWGEVTPFGRMMDPIADKLLVTSVLLFLAGVDQITGPHLFAALLVIARELSVSGVREFIAQWNVTIPVTPLAKWKTFAQLCAIGVLIWSPGLGAYADLVQTIGLFMLWLSVILTLWTAVGYFGIGLQALRGRFRSV